MLPEPSRFTIAFAVAALVGATSQLKARVPDLVMGDPVTLKSVVGALRATLVTVPLPGNVCPETNVTFPVEATLNVVPFRAKATSVPFGNRVRVSRTSPLPLRSRVAAGVVVLMPTDELFW